MANPPVPPVPNPTPGVTPPPPPPGAVLPPPQPQPAVDVQRQATIDEAPGQNADVPQSFWQIPFVQDILPFLASLMLRLGLIGLAILTWKTVGKLADANKEPTIIPDSLIIEGAEVGGIPHPGLGGDETRDAAQD